MAVTLARAGQQETASRRRLDLALLGVVVLAAALIAWFAQAAASGAIPAQNALFDADTGRVLSNLTGSAENYYRLKVHPWHGWICIFYQFVFARLLGVPPETGVPLLSAAIAVGSTGLLFVVLRRFDVGPWASSSYTLLFISTAGFVFWSTVPETHMAGGASSLVAVLLLIPRRKEAAWRSIAGLAVSFSMVVTNAMVWILSKIDFAALRTGLRAFISSNAGQLRALSRQAGWAVALVFLVWAPQWLFLGKRIGIPFNFLEERHYLEMGAGAWSWSLHVLGFLPPGSTLGMVLSMAAIAVPLATLRVLDPKLWFVPLFPLCGVILHTLYGSNSAFLFSPNYLPLWIVSLALLASKTLPKWFPAVLLPVAVILLLFNLQQWQSSLHTLAGEGLMKSYQSAVRY